MFRGRCLDLEITGMFSSSTVILSICLHCCYLLSFLPSFAGPNPQHSEEQAGDAEPCQPPPPEVVTKCRGNVSRAGLSEIICWRLDSWSSFHPFVLLIRHREQTKLPKWSCQKLPTTTGAFLGDNKLAQAPFCQPIKFSIMREPGRGWGWLCGTLAHPWQQQQWRQENECIVPLEALDLLAHVPVELFVDTAECRHPGQHPALL